MNFTIHLHPDNLDLKANPGDILKDVLERNFQRFPQTCGGNGTCGYCRVEFLSDSPPLLKREIDLLGENSTRRLACLHKIRSDINISIPPLQEWSEVKNLADFHIESDSSGLGIAADLGTTTIALYLADLKTGSLLAQSAFLNPQIGLGADVMTRLEIAKDSSRRARLTELVLSALKTGIAELLSLAGKSPSEVAKFTLAGNTVMTHLFLGWGGEGLERAPFRSPFEKRGCIPLHPEQLGLPLTASALALPVIAGFIGGDTTAAILAAGLHRHPASALLIDLGTNGEIVAVSQSRMLAAAAAAGPAFEAVGLSSGMPAVKGAVEKISPSGEPVVIGGGDPIGICGSGYISAIAYLLNAGKISPSGLLSLDSQNQRRWTLNENDSVFITQDDIRKFQLAKGALAAGIKILLEELSLSPQNLSEIFVTGSFGNRIDPAEARHIGLLPDIPLEKIRFIDNAAGRGATLCLGDLRYSHQALQIQHSAEHINLGEHPRFQDYFIENMALRRLS